MQLTLSKSVPCSVDLMYCYYLASKSTIGQHCIWKFRFHEHCLVRVNAPTLTDPPLCAELNLLEYNYVGCEDMCDGVRMVCDGGKSLDGYFLLRQPEASQ